MDKSAGDVGAVSRRARWGTANDRLLALEKAVGTFALGLRQIINPEKSFSGDEFFIVASFGGLDIGFESFHGFGHWSFA